MDHSAVSSGSTVADKKTSITGTSGSGSGSTTPGFTNGSSTASATGTRKISVNKSGKSPKLPTKLPTNIIRPASFIDALAILALLTHVPSVIMVIVHCFYVASFFSNSGLSSISTRAIFGWTTSYDYSYSSGSSSSSSSSNSSGGSNNGNSANDYYSNSSSNSWSNSTNSRKISQSLLLAIGKALLIDFIVAWTTLYIVPLLRNVVIVFAHAIVASTLGGGGPRVFTNAIYSTTLVEVVIFIWGKLYYYLFADDFILPSSLLNRETVGAAAAVVTEVATSASSLSALSSLLPPSVSSVLPSPSHHNLRQLDSPHHHLLFDDSFLSSAGSILSGDSTSQQGSRKSTFNTFLSIYNMTINTVRFIRHMDWAHEFPIIFFQAVAVHVIGLGLVPFIRKVFPERGSLDWSANASGVLSSNSDSSSVDNTSSEVFIDSSINFSFLTDSTSSGNDFPVFNNNLNKTGSSAGKIISVPDYSKDLYSEDIFDDDSYANYRADFDFLYAPSVKKNKRLATVRSNQPLWSILASSIVLAARQETSSSNSVDGDLTSPSGFELAFGQCAVRYILENMVAFEMVNFDPMLVSSNNIYVRVNGIQWPQVSVQTMSTDSNGIKAIAEGDRLSDSILQRPNCLLVIVYGLTPLAQYDMEVVYASYTNDSSDLLQTPVTCMRVNVSTSARRHKSGSGPSNLNSPARPVSPVTTLLDTLTTTQMNLSEEKSRLKKSRKEHAKRLGSLRSEADSLRSKIEASDKGDERNNRKVLSLRELVRQMDEEIEKINMAIETLIGQQGESLAEYEAHKKEWENHMKSQEQKEQSSNELKSNWAKRVQVLESDLNSIAIKCDKLEAKKQRLLGDVEKLESEENAIVTKEIESHCAKRADKLVRRSKVEGEFSDNITKLEKVVEETRRHTAELLASSTVASIYPQQAVLSTQGTHSPIGSSSMLPLNNTSVDQSLQTDNSPTTSFDM